MKVLLGALVFLVSTLAGQAGALTLTTEAPQLPVSQGPSCSDNGTDPAFTRPEPLEPGDEYCEAGEPERHQGRGPGPKDAPVEEDPSGGPAPMSPSSPGGGGGGTYHHWLGVETSGVVTGGIYAGMTVVDPDVTHVSNDYMAQRILVQNCDGSRWFETGWAEAGWSSMYPQQYPFIRTSDSGWGLFVNEGIRPNPGDRVYFMLQPRSTGDGYWQAFMNSNKTSGWLLLSEFYLGSTTACGNEAYVEVDGTSTGRQISFPSTEWGNAGGGDNGVMLRKPDPQGQFEPWTPAKPSVESNSAAGGRYNVTWYNRYYYWKVDYTPPANQYPVVKLNVTPTSGNRSTWFSANLAGTYDPDGDPLNSLRIDWGDGTSSYPSYREGWMSHRYSTAGTYNVIGFACDNRGACANSAPKAVTVADSNSAPTMWLYVNPTKGDTSTTFNAQISALSDPEGDPITNTEIDWGDGTTTQGTSGSHQYAQAGVYTVTASATDSRGAVGSDAEEVTVCEVYAQGTCVSSEEIIDDVTTPVDETIPIPGHEHTYDTPACPGQYLSVTSGACTHPDHSQFLSLDTSETIEADYLAEKGNVPGYCRQQDDPDKYRVVYVHTRNDNSRYGSMKGTIRQKAERADYYLWKSARASNGPGRHFRFACTDQNEIRVWDWTLPNTADDNINATFEKLRAKRDYDHTKRYLVIADWADSGNTSNSCCTCGWGEVYTRADNPGKGNRNNGEDFIALVYLRPVNPCLERAASSMTHEMAHTLGAALESAPHEYDGNAPGWSGHPTDMWDVLGVGSATVQACSDPKFKNRLDCRFDDYFNADPRTPARHTYLADKQEYEDGVCQRLRDGDVQRATECHWNTAWSRWIVGGGS